jgi:5-methyltetrahydropteroyltriglutamate--homocysteine methyltransferase
MADPVLLTTSVGSFPKPDYITEARAEVSRGKMPRSELQGLEQKATEEWIRFQEDLGVDILVDGEMYRGDMAAYFAENLEGFELGGAVRSYGNRYYQKPIAIGEVRRPNPITVEWWQYAQSLTDKPVKGMLTGPYTIADWSFDEHYGSREDFVMALADVIHAEAMDLQAAGAQYIQIDEPAISVRPEEFDIARRAFEVVTAGLSATTLTHICYGDSAGLVPNGAVHEAAVDGRRGRAQPRDGAGEGSESRDPEGAGAGARGPIVDRPGLRVEDPDGGRGQGEAADRRSGGS